MIMRLSVLKAIFDSMEQGVLFLDDQNRITYINSAAERIRNIHSDQVLGQSILDCHPLKAHPKVSKIIEDLKLGRMKRHHWMNIQMLEGKFYDNTYSAVWGARNEYLGVIVISQEVTMTPKYSFRAPKQQSRYCHRDFPYCIQWCLFIPT